MPVQGLVRLRKHQLARQYFAGTKVAATRAYNMTGVPSVDLQWTDPEVDAGSLDPTAAPHREAGEFTGDYTFNSLEYNDIPLLMCGFFGGGVDPSTVATTGRRWTHDPSSTSPEEPDLFTHEFGDDVLEDWYQFGDGIIDNMTISGPEGLGPLTASVNFRYGSASSTGSTDSPVTGTVPTPGLSVDTAGVKVYLKDCAIYIASSVAGLGAGQVSDALYSFEMTFGGDIDEKRWANGSQSFDVDELVRATRNIELACTFAKTDDTVGTGSESDAWFSDTAVNRYVQLKFTSTETVGTATPYAWTITMPMRYYTREETEVGGNTAIVLTGHAFYDPVDFTGVFTSVADTTLSANQLGAVTS